MIVGSGELGSPERGRAAYQAYHHTGSEDHIDDHIGLHTAECSWVGIHASESKIQHRVVPSAEEGTGDHNDKGHD